MKKLCSSSSDSVDVQQADAADAGREADRQREPGRSGPRG
jgi:hypothetical protein